MSADLAAIADALRGAIASMQEALDSIESIDPTAFKRGDRVRFIDLSEPELFAAVATVRERAAAGIHVHFDGDPEAELWICEPDQLEKIDADWPVMPPGGVLYLCTFPCDDPACRVDPRKPDDKL